MSVLGRLAAQASGRVAPRLRPKLPTRFEGQGGEQSGFTVVNDEHRVAPPEPAQESVAGPAKPGMNVDLLPDPTRAPRTLESRTEQAVEPGALPKMPAELSDKATSRPTEVAGFVAPKTSQPEPAKAVGFRPKTTERLETTRIEGATIEPAHTPDRPEMQQQTSDPPKPLLPPTEPDGFRSTAPDLQSHPSDLRHPIAQAKTSAPPEITIHIGRIDLRQNGQQAVPSRSTRAQPERPVSALNEYLKGGRS